MLYYGILEDTSAIHPSSNCIYYTPILHIAWVYTLYGTVTFIRFIVLLILKENTGTATDIMKNKQMVILHYFLAILQNSHKRNTNNIKA